MGTEPDDHLNDLEAFAAPPTSHAAQQPSSAQLSADHVPCLRCGYNLRGLTSDRACPECGTPIVRSLQGNLLIYSSPEYVASLHMGLICILISVLLMVVLSAVGVVYGVAMAASGGAGGMSFEALFGLFIAGVAMLSLVGWWMFSAPDPAILGDDKGDTPRKVVRATVVIVATATVLTTTVNLAPIASPALHYAGTGMQIVSSIAGLVQFFASMMYVKWLAPRLPNRVSAAFIAGRVRTYMWLLPLIYVVGFVCLFLGPLVAMIMYYLLLNRMRVELRAIREHQAAEAVSLVQPV